MSSGERIGIGIVVVVVAGLMFLLLDCGMGQRVSCHARIVGSHYEPPHSWVSMECMSHDPKSGACTMSIPVTHHEPEHYYALVESDLGSGRLESRALYDLSPNGKCNALFSKGRWTGRTWGPLRCDPLPGW